MRFGHIEMVVSDLSRSARFYRDVLGFEEVQAQEPEFLRLCGELEILLRSGRPPAAAAWNEGTGAGTVFYTSRPARAAARLVARGLAFRGPLDSEKCLTFSDPDGNWFQLVDPQGH